MVQSVNTPINFKADTIAYPTVSYNNRYTPPMPDNSIDDVFLMQEMANQKAIKKEKSKEKWDKAGVLAQAGIAVAFLGMLIVNLIGLKKGGQSIADAASEAAKKELDTLTKVNINWDDFAEKKIVAPLDSKTTSKALKGAFKNMIDSRKITEKAKNWGGGSDNTDIIYLYGHGGTGKTYIAKQFAQEMGAKFTSIKYPDIGSPFKDAGSMKINRFFENIIEAAEKEKDRQFVVCIDEIDAIIKKVQDASQGSGEASKARAAVLTGLDRVREHCSNVTIIATSNYHPKNGIVDPIVLRRFNNMILAPLPEVEQAEALLKMYLEKQNIGALKDSGFIDGSDFKNFAKKLHNNGYSNGEISLIAEEAGKIFRSSLIGVADADLPKHKFTVKFLEDAMKLKGEAASKTNDLMDVAKTNRYNSWVNHQNSQQNKAKLSVFERIKQWISNKF